MYKFSGYLINNSEGRVVGYAPNKELASQISAAHGHSMSKIYQQIVNTPFVPVVKLTGAYILNETTGFLTQSPEVTEKEINVE